MLFQGKDGGKHNITKNVDLRKAFENTPGEQKLIHNNPILTAVIKNHLQSYDPRSPTQEFDRTPIILITKIEEYNERQKLYQLNSDDNESLKETVVDDLDNSYSDEQHNPEIVPKKLFNDFSDISLDETLKETEEPVCSSTVSQEVIEENIQEECDKEPTKFLETNFDYVDTANTKIVENSIDHIDGQEKEINAKIAPLKILENDPRSPSVGIERTPIIIARTNEDYYEGNIEELSDDLLIKALQETNSGLRQTVNKNHDKNIELLIYEDESANFDNNTPKKPDSNNGSRTPLSCVKNKADTTHVIQSKSVNTQNDSKKKNMTPRVSHIPRLKALSKNSGQTKSMMSLKSMSKNSGINGYCENTPPQTHRDIWDKDNSIVL